MSNVWKDFEEIQVETITWDEVNQKVKSAKFKSLWIKAVVQGLNDCRPMGDCPFYGRIPTKVLIKCRKDKENGVGKCNKRRSNNLFCKQECIIGKAGEQNITIITGNGSTTRN